MARESGLDEYLSQLSKSLDCPRTQKKQVLRDVKLSLLEIPHIHELTLEEIKASEDPPEEVARSYLEGLTDHSPRQLRRKRTFHIVIVSILLLAVVLLGVYIVDALSYSHGTYSESPAYSGTGPMLNENPNVQTY